MRQGRSSYPVVDAAKVEGTPKGSGSASWTDL
jgi:hypothetical protein